MELGWNWNETYFFLFMLLDITCQMSVISNDLTKIGIYIESVKCAQPVHYIPVCHDIMRQTNDCSPVRVMQHKVKYFLYLT